MVPDQNLIKIVVVDPRIDGVVTSAHRALLALVGRIEICVGSDSWYSEEEFCLLEFLKALQAWQSRLSDGDCCAFEYASMESSEDYLVRVEPGLGGECTLRSPHASERLIVSTVDVVELLVQRLAADIRAVAFAGGVMAWLAKDDSNQALVALLLTDAQRGGQFPNGLGG